MELVALLLLLLAAMPLWILLAFVAYWVQNRKISLISLANFWLLEFIAITLTSLHLGNTTLARRIVAINLVIVAIGLPLDMARRYLLRRQVTIRELLLLTAYESVLLALLRALSIL